MRFYVGEIPLLEGFSDEGFTLLREPSGGVLDRIIGILFAVFLVVALTLWLVFIQVDWPESILTILFQAVLVTAVLIPIHELLHAITYPLFGRGEVILGYWPQKFYFYAVYTGEISKIRLTTVFVAPFLILSVLPFAIAVHQDNVASWIGLASILNAAFSCADLYFAYLVISQVPWKARLQNNGWKTYWH